MKKSPKIYSLHERKKKWKIRKKKSFPFPSVKQKNLFPFLLNCCVLVCSCFCLNSHIVIYLFMLNLFLSINNALYSFHRAFWLLLLLFLLFPKKKCPRHEKKIIIIELFISIEKKRRFLYNFTWKLKKFLFFVYFIHFFELTIVPTLKMHFMSLYLLIRVSYSLLCEW